MDEIRKSVPHQRYRTRRDSRKSQSEDAHRDALDSPRTCQAGRHGGRDPQSVCRPVHHCARFGPRYTLTGHALGTNGPTAPKLLKVTKTNGGGRGIRTPGTLSSSTVFKTAGLNRSPI